jgi:hypothetical protein
MAELRKGKKNIFKAGEREMIVGSGENVRSDAELQTDSWL